MRLKTKFLAACLSSPLLLAAPAAAQDQPGSDTPPEAHMERTPVPELPGATSYQGAIQVCEAARGEHRIRMEAGRRYSILASSDAFDTFLRLLRPGSDEAIAENDDGGGGLNSRITFTPTESGEYLVRVSSFSPGGVGDYRLQVAPAGPMPALLTRPTRTERGQWRVYQGDLGTADALEDGRRYDDYELRLAAGQSAMIHLEGLSGLDPMLKVYSLAGRGGEPLAENDDAYGSTASFILFTPPEAGTYVVRVTSFAENVTGGYRLRIGQ